MIPSLILLLLRRYQRRHPAQAQVAFRRLHVVARLALVLLLTAGVALYAFSQERVLQYTIVRSGNAVGSLILRETKEGHRTSYKLQSAVKTSFLFTVTLKTVEEAVYENGVLTYLRFYQKMNSTERANTEIRATGTGYMLTSEKTPKPINKEPITYNLVCLYTVEPLHWKRMFADKFKQFVPIETLGPHHYKITFPDGAYNEYYYRDGICVKAKLYTTWFDAEMNLKP